MTKIKKNFVYKFIKNQKNLCMYSWVAVLPENLEKQGKIGI